jgi:hypothetical protein
MMFHVSIQLFVYLIYTIYKHTIPNILGEVELEIKKIIESFDVDGYLWLCYPKGTSKKYKSDINRDKSWELFKPYDFEAVTIVAIDDDWSALRFRHHSLIKSRNK